MADDDISEIARAMIRQYDEHAAELMETRSRSCRRHGEMASATFWHSVAREVRRILGTGEALRIRRDALRKAGSRDVRS